MCILNHIVTSNFTQRGFWMENKEYSRRNFLQTAAIGATVVAAGQLFTGSAKTATPESKTATPETKTSAVGSSMNIFVCSVCGHIEFGSAPESCPVCHVPKENFTLNNSIFTDAKSNNKDGGIKHDPVITIKKESTLVSELPCHEVSVRIGKTMHPMEEAHHIKFMDLYSDDKFTIRLSLPLSLYPAVSLYVKVPGSKIKVVELCNLHGYWQSEASMA